MAKQFKVSVHSANVCTEIRRLSLPSDCSYQLLKEKLGQIFPNESFQLSWKDAEGDQISLTTEDDFRICIENQNELVNLSLIRNQTQKEDICWIVVNGPGKVHLLVKKTEKFGTLFGAL